MKGNVAQQVILSYLPTTISTLIEPVWVLLTRWICILQPFNTLKSTSASARKSLQLNYEALPPHFISLRAIQNGHYVIALLGILTILSNVLTIALNGLFFINTVPIEQAISLQASRQPHFTYDPFEGDVGPSGTPIDNYYIVMSNVSANTSLPSWLSTRQFFIPLSLSIGEKDDTVRYRFNTTGIGASLECQDLGGSNATGSFNISSDSSSVSFYAPFTEGDGSRVLCGSSISLLSVGSVPPLFGTSVGQHALEIVSTVTSLDGVKPASDFCSSVIVWAWLRGNLTTEVGGSPSTPVNNTTTSSPSNSNVTLSSISSTFIACRPRIYSTSSTVTVNPSGAVLAADAVEPIISSSDVVSAMSSVSDRLRDLSVTVYDEFRGGAHRSSWHNDTIAGDWTNYLIQQLTKSTGFVDPSQTVPHSENAIELVSDSYSRAWAAQVAAKASALATVPNTTANSVTGIRSSMQERVFMSAPMFWIAFCILLLDVIAALFVYTTSPRPFLPRMPTSIASVIAYFAASHSLEDFKVGGNNSNCEADQVLKIIGEPMSSGGKDIAADGVFQLRAKYRYGKFIGTDGWSHTGIERSSVVAPLETRSRKWWQRHE